MGLLDGVLTCVLIYVLTCVLSWVLKKVVLMTG